MKPRLAPVPVTIAVVFSAALGVLASCGDKDTTICTDIGCTDGLDLSFSPAYETAGEYLVTVEADALTITCTASLPLTGDLATCDADGVYLGTSGSALEESEHRITGVFLETGPATVRLVVARDGEEVLEAELSPTYQTFTPNGEGCEPTCTYASESLITGG